MASKEDREFVTAYADKLLKRVERKLRRGASRRQRRAYKHGYQIAADRVSKLTR